MSESTSHLAIAGGRPLRKEPFPSWPQFDQSDRDALTSVLEEPTWGIDSPRTTAFEAEFAAFQRCRHALACANGTVALEIALKALGIGPGDEVVLPSYTFVASATAVIATGAAPVFADIDPLTYNIDPADAEQRITPRTAALMPVHFAGAPADMTAIMALADRHRLAVVEDAAQAVCAEWDGRKVGAIGQFGTFSFQSSKNLTSGEGGAVTTDDDALRDEAISMLNCGRKPGGAWYRHYAAGSNHRLSAFQAALLSVQLTRVEEQTARREENAAYLSRLLSERVEGITATRQPERVTRHAVHLMVLRYRPEAWKGLPKSKLVKALNGEGIPASVGYLLPLYHQNLFELESVCQRPGRPGEDWRSYDYSQTVNPNCERACNEEAIWLPHRALLGSRADMESVVDALQKIRDHLDELLLL